MKTGELNGGRMAGDAAPQPPSAEEEALKKSTDCVYFLASPLTCIKVFFSIHFFSPFFFMIPHSLVRRFLSLLPEHYLSSVSRRNSMMQ